ncbi:SsrA-binding protein [Flindersiella endophytica]
MVKEKGRKAVATNRRARYEYHIEETFEAGLVLTGTEVKSLRAGLANLSEAYALIMNGEAWLQQAHIPEYSHGTWTNHSARRSRKLLLHRKEIDRLQSATQEKGLTLVPLSLYFSDGRAKVEIGLARGKKFYDKRQAIAKREADRDAARSLADARKARR